VHSHALIASSLIYDLLQVYPKSTNSEVAMNEIHVLISTRFKQQSGIVYCLTQRDTEDVAAELRKRGLHASCYHANMDAISRSRVHADWSSNRLQVNIYLLTFFQQGGQSSNR
jgi:ATP-dependent DNA helicase Q1